MKILIVDDHKMFCDGLRLIIRQLDFETEVLEAQHSVAAFELLSHHPDIELVMLDIKLPDRDGVDILRELSDRFPTLPVIMLTASASRQVVNQCFSAGASGYVLKSTGAEIMLNAIRLVLDGGIYVPPNMVNTEDQGITTARNGNAASGLLSKLTPRQVEVFQLLKTGISNKEIASRLELSESTVKAHISAVLNTLKLRSRVEAALLAQKLESDAG